MVTQIETRETMARLLSEVWGGPVCLANEQSLGDNSRTPVSRWEVIQSPANAPSTVVVKRAVQEEDHKFGAETHFFNEWAGLKFLEQCFEEAGDLPLPHFIAADAGARMIIMQDIGSGIGLEDYLLGDNPDDAANALISMWTMFGRIHATTCGRQEQYYAIRDTLTPREAAESDGDRAKSFAEAVAGGLAHFGITPPSQYIQEMEDLLDARFADGPFRAFVHGDACPDNIQWIDSRPMTYDLGFSSMCNVAHEMAFPRMAFNTCFYRNRTPPGVLDRVESAYRNELSKGCPAALDDKQFWRQMSAGCAYSSMHFLSRPNDIKWVEWQFKEAKLGRFGGMQHILTRLDGFVNVCETHAVYPVIGEIAAALALNIRGRLPADFLEMPVYPAFR